MTTNTLVHPVRGAGASALSRAERRSRLRLLLLLACAYGVIGALLALPAHAELRDYTVRWLPSPSQGVEGYELAVGTSSGSYESTFDLGLPEPQGGELHFDMQLEGSIDLHLALRAYGGEAVSEYSNEIVVAAVAEPGEPAPPTFGVSSIEGITGVVSGPIVVFAETFGPAESVQFLLDGVSYRIENVAPWALAGDGGEPGTENAFDTTSLADGEHTLTAIAYAADSAAGAASEPVTVTFHVDNSSNPPTPEPPTPEPPTPTPTPPTDPGPVAGPEGAVAGLYATDAGDIVALRVDGSTSTLTTNPLAAAGDMRPVWCDLDGDEDRDLVIGFGPGSGGQVLILMIEDQAVVDEEVLVTAWAKYNEKNGETYPGCGDIDGDQRNELAIGLGGGSLATVAMHDDRDSGFQPFMGNPNAKLRTMPGLLTLGLDYLRGGAAKPVLADVDGDGYDEIVVGRTAGGRGTVSILDDARNDMQVIWKLRRSDGLLEVVPDDAYQAANGATQVAAGDIDGDGYAEIVVGTGTEGGNRLFVYDDAQRNFKVLADSSNGLELGHASDAATGILVPSLADVDGDGLPEIALGLGEAGSGTVQVLDDMLTDFAPLAWTGDASGMVAAPEADVKIESALEPSPE